jgi:hypothetical protein
MTTQVRKMIKYHLPFYELFVLLILIDPNQIHATGVFSWYHIATAVFCAVTVYTTAVPGLFPAKPKRNTSVELTSVLGNSELRTLFENFLKSEFQIQLLKFYDAASELNEIASDADAKMPSNVWCLHARNVYSTYVDSKGLAPVRILSDHTYIHLTAQVDANDESRSPGLIFEAAVQETEVVLQGELMDRFVHANMEAIVGDADSADEKA